MEECLRRLFGSRKENMKNSETSLWDELHFVRGLYW